jgi:hypothetical protein
MHETCRRLSFRKRTLQDRTPSGAAHYRVIQCPAYDLAREGIEDHRETRLSRERS